MMEDRPAGVEVLSVSCIHVASVRLVDYVNTYVTVAAAAAAAAAAATAAVQTTRSGSL